MGRDDLHDVLGLEHRVHHEFAGVLIDEAVIDASTLLTGLHHLAPAQLRQVLRDRGG